MFRKKKPPVAPEGRRRPADRQANTAVFSYYSSDVSSDPAPTSSQRKKPKKEWSRRQKLVLAYGIAGIFLLLILFCTTLSTTPAISFADPNITESPYQPADVYQDRANELLSQHLGSMSKFTINPNAVEQQLLKEFPELSAAHISLPVIGRRPKLILMLRRPAMVLTTKSNAFIIDGTGRAVAEYSKANPDFRKNLPSAEDGNDIKLEVGSQAVTSETVTFIEQALAQLKAKNLEVERLTLPSIANELDIKIKGINYFIKADVSGNARQQIGSFLAVKDSGVGANEYMDVRVEEKVFYK